MWKRTVVVGTVVVFRTRSLRTRPPTHPATAYFSHHGAMVPWRTLERRKAKGKAFWPPKPFSWLPPSFSGLFKDLLAAFTTTKASPLLPPLFSKVRMDLLFFPRGKGGEGRKGNAFHLNKRKFLLRTNRVTEKVEEEEERRRKYRKKVLESEKGEIIMGGINLFMLGGKKEREGGGKKIGKLITLSCLSQEKVSQTFRIFMKLSYASMHFFPLPLYPSLAYAGFSHLPFLQPPSHSLFIHAWGDLPFLRIMARRGGGGGTFFSLSLGVAGWV